MGELWVGVALLRLWKLLSTFFDERCNKKCKETQELKAWVDEWEYSGEHGYGILGENLTCICQFKEYQGWHISKMDLPRVTNPKWNFVIRRSCGYGIVWVEVGALVRIVSSKALGTWGAARVEEANQKYRQKVGQRYKYRNKTWGSHQEKKHQLVRIHSSIIWFGHCPDYNMICWSEWFWSEG